MKYLLIGLLLFSGCATIPTSNNANPDVEPYHDGNIDYIWINGQIIQVR